MDYLHPTYSLAKRLHGLRRKHVFNSANPNRSPPSTPSSSSSASPQTSVQFSSNQKWQQASNNLIVESLLPLNPPKQQQQQHKFFKPTSEENNLHIVDGSTGTNNKNFGENFINSFSKINNQTSPAIMWPYQSYKPISWDKYYAHDLQDKHVSITSGLAAGITIGVFFAVFLLTFGCRLYSQRADSRHRSQSSSPRRRLSVSDLLGWPSPTVCHPPPPYEIAIQMPAPCSTTTLSTLVSSPCEPPAPTYEDSCRHGFPSHSISPPSFSLPSSSSSTVQQQQQPSTQSQQQPQRFQQPHSEIRTV